MRYQTHAELYRSKANEMRLRANNSRVPYEWLALAGFYEGLAGDADSLERFRKDIAAC